MKDQKSKNSNKRFKKNNTIVFGILALIVFGVVAFAFFYTENYKESLAEQPTKPTAISATDANGHMVIKTADITEKATYYAYDELDTYMEVLAVKASDGTIRTSFNTCQVCYASGRGYYVQEGDVLICQNCGNSFRMDDVELVRGGCNPVPISMEMKEVTDTTITIPKDVFIETENIFANWK